MRMYHWTDNPTFRPEPTHMHEINYSSSPDGWVYCVSEEDLISVSQGYTRTRRYLVVLDIDDHTPDPYIKQGVWLTSECIVHPRYITVERIVEFPLCNSSICENGAGILGGRCVWCTSAYDYPTSRFMDDLQRRLNTVTLTQYTP